MSTFLYSLLHGKSTCLLFILFVYSMYSKTENYVIFLFLCVWVLFHSLGRFPVLDIEEHAAYCQGQTHLESTSQRHASSYHTATAATAAAAAAQIPFSDENSRQSMSQRAATSFFDVGECPVCAKRLPMTLLPGHVDLCLISSDVL